MLRKVILAAAGSTRVERLVESAPVSRNVVRRFIAGTGADDALRCTHQLVENGLGVTIDHLGEDTTNPEQADATAGEYLALLDALHAAELTPAAEVSVKLSALGQVFDDKQAYAHARAICAKASEAGTTVTLDMEDHTTTDSTLEILHKLRVDFPTVGVAIQAYLRRSEADCRELAVEGMRVRLCKGAYREPESVAFQTRIEVDKSYVRCLNALMAGDGYPMIAFGLDRRGPGALVRPQHRRVRVPDAVRGAPRRAVTAGGARLHDARLPAVRHAVVRVHDAPDGRATGEQRLLRPRAAVPRLSRPSRDLGNPGLERAPNFQDRAGRERSGPAPRI
jgi:proline dehydrogenase